MSKTTGSDRKISHHFELVFDGGSRGNPGRAYGSYRIKRDDKPLSAPVRFNLGEGTNNEAEYRTLIRALEDLLQELEQERIKPQAVKLKIYGDSQLVIRQLQGQWKAKDARMREMRDQILQMGRSFGRVEFLHQSRWRSLAALGH